MKFIVARNNSNYILIPLKDKNYTSLDSRILIEHKKTKRPISFISLEPDDKIIIIKISNWNVEHFKRKGIEVVGGMTMSAKDYFRIIEDEEETRLYLREHDFDPIEFATYDDAALWAAVQEPLFGGTR